MSNLISALDNRMNPIVVKELRQGFQSRFIIILVNLLLTALTLTCIFAMGAVPGSPGGEIVNGRTAFFFLEFILLVATFFVIPSYIGFRLSKERGKQRFRRSVVCADLLFITSMKSHQIVRGKFYTGLIFNTLLYSLCLPFMLFTSLVNGYDVPAMLFALLVCYIITIPVLMVAVFVGAIRGVFLSFFFYLFGFFFLTQFIGITAAILEYGIQGILREEGAILYILIAFFVTFLAIKVLGAMSVGVLAPTASNRTRPLRVWMTITFIALGLVSLGFGLYAMWSASGSSFSPPSAAFILAMTSWFSVCALLTLLMLGIAISEPDGFSNRLMQERSPRFLGRLVSLPFTHGTAGGFAWVILTMMFLFGSMVILAMTCSSSSFLGTSSLFFDISGILSFFLNIAAYMLTAKVIMRLVFPQDKAKNTWAVVILLVPITLFSSWLLCYLLDPYRWHTMLLWKTVNPFSGGYDEYTYTLAAPRFWTVTIWLSIAALCCLPAGLRDVRHEILRLMPGNRSLSSRRPARRETLPVRKTENRPPGSFTPSRNGVTILDSGSERAGRGPTAKRGHGKHRQLT